MSHVDFHVDSHVDFHVDSEIRKKKVCLRVARLTIHFKMYFYILQMEKIDEIFAKIFDF